MRETLLCRKETKAAKSAVVFMILSGLVRLGYYLFICSEKKTAWLVGIHLLLPTLAVFGLAAVFLAVGDRTLKPMIPFALMGVIFFACKALTFAFWHRAFCLCLYALAGGICLGTALGFLRRRIWLFLVFFLPFTVHVSNDIFRISRTGAGTDWLSYLPEVSVLCLMAGMFCFALSLRGNGENFL